MIEKKKVGRGLITGSLVGGGKDLELELMQGVRVYHTMSLSLL